MAQHGARAARQDRRGGAAEERERRVSDRVNAAEDPVQASGRKAAPDRRVAQTEVEQLLARHDPVLPRRKIGLRSTYVSHSDLNVE